MAELSGRRILVVGASGGLGAPIARALTEAGATVVLHGRDPRRLAAVGVDGAAVHTGDLRDPAVPAALIRQVAAAGLDGVVIASGVVAFGTVADVTDDLVDELMAVNFTGPQQLIRAALATLPPGGFVVSISGIVAEMPTAGMSAYSASKAALSAFAVSARIEARRRRIRVIDARPPHTETGLAGRPIAGTAPALAPGLAPEKVAARIVRALLDDETELPAVAFTD
jgi:cyclic-di-GMP-binding biofilm dispersal mediator protein